MPAGNTGYEARVMEQGELCSNGTVVKTRYEGQVTLVPEAEVYVDEPDDRTHTVVTDEVDSFTEGPEIGDNYLATPVTLAIGSTPANVATSAFDYWLSGTRYEKGAVAAGTAFTATTHDIADPDANPREAIYVLSANAAGTITITKGATAVEDAAVAPATPAGQVKIGEVKVQHDGTLPFDATTDALNAAHLTVTYTPAEPYGQ